MSNARPPISELRTRLDAIGWPRTESQARSDRLQRVAAAFDKITSSKKLNDLHAVLVEIVNTKQPSARLRTSHIRPFPIANWLIDNGHMEEEQLIAIIALFH